MQILLAPDKFKGSLSSVDVCRILAATISTTCQENNLIISCPISDGGDGFRETMRAALGGHLVSVKVRDPLGRETLAEYAMAGEVAIVEMARASGLALIEQDERDPWRASSHGTGDLIRHASENGAGRILLGIGGSATNDGGVGMALALGFTFLDATGQPVLALPERLLDVELIVPPNRDHWPEIEVACDVENPLLGPNGCTRIYGPQKGVLIADVGVHEARLQKLINLLEGESLAGIPGSGAAGGLGFGLMAFAQARLTPGFSLVAEALDLETKVRNADLIITAEGRLDASSLMGKAPASLARMAQKQGCPIIAFCGSVDVEALPELDALFNEIIPISPPELPLTEALERAPELLAIAVKKSRLLNA